MLAYPLPALTRDGRLAECEMVAVSSGSTGKPLFWPRSSVHELDIATRFEHVFHGSFHADTHPTLVVICFALGSWVGGMYTLLPVFGAEELSCSYRKLYPTGAKPRITRCFRSWETFSN